MKDLSLIAAAAILGVSNAALLLHAARNRMGTPDADVVLTQRELRYYGSSFTEDDSGVVLHLDWSDPTGLPQPEPQFSAGWPDRATLERLGFDCSVDPASPKASRHYALERPRQGYAALELDGPAFHSWLDNYRRVYNEATGQKPPPGPIEDAPYRSHLVAIDADADPAALRARHPDRASVLLLPAVFAIALATYTPTGLTGRIQELPTIIHVPRPFSDRFRRIDRNQLGYRQSVSYRVHLRVGSLFEPWVAAVDFQ